MDLTFPTPVFLFSLGNEQSPTSSGDALSYTRWGYRASQPGHSGSLPAGDWLCNPPFLWMCWNSFPFVCPSDPICSATAQMQFRRPVPPASSWALSLRNHSNPPKQRPSNLNKPSDISLASQDAEQDSFHACLFETLWLCWPLSSSPSQCTPLSLPGQTQHILVDLGTVLSQQDTSAFCDLKPYFSEVQLCLFIEINLHSIWFVTSWPHHQGSNRQDPVVTSALDTLGSIFYRNSSAT